MSFFRILSFGLSIINPLAKVSLSSIDHLVKGVLIIFKNNLGPHPPLPSVTALFSRGKGLLVQFRIGFAVAADEKRGNDNRDQ